MLLALRKMKRITLLLLFSYQFSTLWMRPIIANSSAVGCREIWKAKDKTAVFPGG